MNFWNFLPVERLLLVSSNNQLAYWDFTCLGTAFLRWKYPGEIAVPAHRSLPQDFLGWSLSDSLRMHL
jgi:hypothetical protein